MGLSQSREFFLPPSSGAIIIILGMQKYEKEAPWKREQLAKQVREDPDVLALSCWAVACEQQPGKIPNPGGLRTPDQFVVAFREAVRQPPAREALQEWYGRMHLPVPDVYLSGDGLVSGGGDDADGAQGPSFALADWVCGYRSPGKSSGKANAVDPPS